MELDRIEGKVIGSNSLHACGRLIQCWTNAMPAAVAPQPLDLEGYMDQVVEVSGRLHGDLWEARFERVVEGYQEITGKVIGLNIIESSTGPISCYRHGMVEAWVMPLNLLEYMDLTITVAGELDGSTLYRASIVRVPEITVDRDPTKEAKSLNDLLRIRAANRDKIEAVNGNLGTALGFKVKNGLRTDHPCVIIFVPQKTAFWLIPDAEKAPEVLEAPDGKWCFTDVITGGKPPHTLESHEEIKRSLPKLSAENEIVVQELRSGRIGLIGGIHIAHFSDFGTAGIAVWHKETKKVGFLTNQHVAVSPGKRIYHPRYLKFPIGRTESTKEYAVDEKWYDGVIDEENSHVRCDCGFVVVDEELSARVKSGLHVIGKTGTLLRINPDTMDIIGQKVISIGRERGVQRGTIVAYSYEYHDDFLFSLQEGIEELEENLNKGIIPDELKKEFEKNNISLSDNASVKKSEVGVEITDEETFDEERFIVKRESGKLNIYYNVIRSEYTDLLIIGEEGKAFSAYGDSGKIMVTDDENHYPVALLWGGWQAHLRHGREQENWTYAIDLGKVLDRLNLELLE